MAHKPPHKQKNFPFRLTFFIPVVVLNPTLSPSFLTFFGKKYLGHCFPLVSFLPANFNGFARCPVVFFSHSGAFCTPALWFFKNQTHLGYDKLVSTFFLPVPFAYIPLGKISPGANG